MPAFYNRVGMVEVVVLDAMGVIYADADDVGQLLLPFLSAKGLDSVRDAVEPLYLACSRGEFSSDELWVRLGATSDVNGWDAEYLGLYRLTPGAREFLEGMSALGRARVAALTNDTSAWSLGLRRQFGIEHMIDPWIVSGDVGHRKPDHEIYRRLLAALPTVRPESMLFVDDRVANLDAAAELGLGTVQFGGVAAGDHPVVGSFAELLTLVDVLDVRAAD